MNESTKDRTLNVENDVGGGSLGVFVGAVGGGAAELRLIELFHADDAQGKGCVRVRRLVGFLNDVVNDFPAESGHNNSLLCSKPRRRRTTTKTRTTTRTTITTTIITTTTTTTVPYAAVQRNFAWLIFLQNRDNPTH